MKRLGSKWTEHTISIEPFKVPNLYEKTFYNENVTTLFNINIVFAKL